MKNNIISYYEIFFGLGGTLLFLLSFESFDYPKFLLIIGAICLFSGLAFAGFFLLKNRKSGFYLSIFFQFIQIFSFNLFGFKYSFCGGSRLSIHLLDFEIDFALFLNEFIIGLNRPNDFFAFNLVPIAIIAFLLNNNERANIK